jgi:Asp-tRNA(Asn)/Glu-tRNA(Gln) amidotransferase A subunit family amidase
VSAWATVVVSALALRLAAHAAETGMPESAPAFRSLGLGFTPDQARQLEPAARESRNALDAIRSKPTSPDVPQSLVFRPFAHVPPMPDGLRWSPPRGVRRPVRDEDLAWMGVADLAALLRSRQVTSEELVRLSLQRLHERDRTIRAVVSWCDERAIEAARRADVELRAGRWKGPLHGVPFGAKDLLDVAALPTSWGVAVRSNAIATSSATVIQRLEDAGAILVAKLSLGELAMGDVWHGGKTRNPWAPDTGSSGSSAGSAAAVAAGLVPFAIGSETLGSIVSPATVCGITGLRPTFGRVPRTGAMALCPSLDKLGVLARTAEDSALVLSVIQGPDGEDPAAVNAGFRWDDVASIRGFKVGVLRADLAREKGGESRHESALAALRELGVELHDVQLPSHPREPLMLILHAEASASFEPWVRDGRAEGLVQQEDWNWPNQFRAARLVPAVEYLEANRARWLLAREMERILSRFDAVVAPPWAGDALMFSNFSGHPCVVLPDGAKDGGKPNTFCLLGRWFGEERLLKVARAYQKATPWHRARPPGF